jgi:hypothetical protein
LQLIVKEQFTSASAGLNNSASFMRSYSPGRRLSLFNTMPAPKKNPRIDNELRGFLARMKRLDPPGLVKR